MPDVSIMHVRVLIKLHQFLKATGLVFFLCKADRLFISIAMQKRRKKCDFRLVCFPFKSRFKSDFPRHFFTRIASPALAGRLAAKIMKNGPYEFVESKNGYAQFFLQIWKYAKI